MEKMLVTQYLTSIPGIGKAGAVKLLESAKIPVDKKFTGLGNQQESALESAVAAHIEKKAKAQEKSKK